MDLLYAFATLVVGWLLGLATVILARRVGRARDIREQEMMLGVENLPYQVMCDGEVIFNTDNLQLAKDFRREAKDSGLPARLRVNGKDRG